MSKSSGNRGVVVVRINKALNRIYNDAAIADMNSRQPGQKDTRKSLKRLWKAHDALPSSGLQVVIAQLRESLEGVGVVVPKHVRDPDLGQALTVAILRSTLNTRPMPDAQKGIGARRFHAFDRLIDLYCLETGQEKPYYDPHGGEWRRIQPAKFAIKVMCIWRLWRDDEDTADSMLRSWTEEHGRMRKGISTWDRFAPS